MSSSIRIGNGGFAPAPLNPYTISGAMSVGDAVYLVPGSALTVARADANDAAKRPPIGIVAGISGSTAQVAGSGAVASGLVGLTVGAVYYLDTSPGGITTTVPASDIYILGVAISTSQILVGTVPKDLVGGGGGASSLQDAYDGGATITTASSTDLAFTLTSGGFTVNGGGAVDIGYTGTDVSAFNVGAGTITLDAVTTTVTGDLVVQGTTTTVESETVLIADNFLSLNNGYTTDAAVTGGIVVNYDPTTTTTTVAAGGFTAGVASVSNPTVATVGAATFAVGDLVQISGTSDPDNNGLFEVLSHAANLLTIRGVGTTGTVETFTQNQFDTSAGAAGTITKVNVSVLRASTSGDWEAGKGSSTPLSFSSLGPTGGTSGQVFTSNGGSAPTFQSMPYDVSGEVAGTPTASTTVFHFKAARAFTLKGTGHVADCDAYPSSSATFTIKKTVSGVASNIGTIAYGTSSVTVSITGSSDVSFAIGNILTIVAPADLYGLENPFFTFVGTCP
jgi:hypothetical protein